jgi:hypothetical protein
MLSANTSVAGVENIRHSTRFVQLFEVHGPGELVINICVDET